MANYTTSTSDKLKKKALLWWLIGLIGLCGFENFYVGKIKAGLIRTAVGVFLSLGFYAIFTEAQEMTPVVIIVWLVIALPNLFRILLGKFRDNVGNALRE